jgi:hypothetical protein
VYIPKGDGRERPLGVAALEDKIVPQAVVTILKEIYEADFGGYSYGFRPGRSPHQALDARKVGIQRKRVNWILDADIRGFFDNRDQEWTMQFVAHRVADNRVLRLIEFGRFAPVNRQQRGEGKAETFTFLGFTHYGGTNSQGHFGVWGRTAAQRMRAKLQAIKQELRRHLHEAVGVVGAWLKRVVEGYYRYHAVPGNRPALGRFRDRLCRLWWQALRRRSQKRRPTWDRLRPVFERWIPRPRVLHPYPDVRFDATHSR